MAYGIFIASFYRRMRRSAGSMWNTYERYTDTYPLTTKMITVGGLYGAGDFTAQITECIHVDNGPVVAKQTQVTATPIQTETTPDTAIGSRATTYTSKTSTSTSTPESNSTSLAISISVSTSSALATGLPPSGLPAGIPASVFDITRAIRLGSFGAIIEAPILHFWYTFLDRKFPPQAVAKKLLLDQLICAPVVYVMFFPYLGLLKRQNMEEIRTKIEEDFVQMYLIECGLWIPANWFNFKKVPPKYRVAFVGVVSYFWSLYLAFAGK